MIVQNINIFFWDALFYWAKTIFFFKFRLSVFLCVYYSDPARWISINFIPVDGAVNEQLATEKNSVMFAKLASRV